MVSREPKLPPLVENLLEDSEADGNEDRGCL
jgi:hypothetical protein